MKTAFPRCNTLCQAASLTGPRTKLTSHRLSSASKLTITVTQRQRQHRRSPLLSSPVLPRSPTKTKTAAADSFHHLLSARLRRTQSRSSFHTTAMAAAIMDGPDDLAERFEVKAQVAAPGKGKKGGKTKDNAGAGAGAGGAQKKEKDISRALSRLLRHQATNAGIALDAEGYAPLEKVLQYQPIRSLKATLQDILAVTASNEKQRFSMKPADPTTATSSSSSSAAAESDPSYWLIRANQGHSIPLASAALLTPLTPATVPAVVVHGTYLAFWDAIVASGGLRRMGRNHVHCSTGVGDGKDDEVVSGMRGDAELLVYVDVARALEDGMTWWVSENGVVLTEGLGEEGLVPVRYFKEVVGRKTEGGVGVLWRDGEKVADLPEGLEIRAPFGKGGRGGGRGRGRGGRGGGRGRGDAASGGRPQGKS